MNLVGADGAPIQTPTQQAAAIQAMAQGVVKQAASLPPFRVHLDACHEHLKKTGAKPTGGQADTLATLKLVADFQDSCSKLIDQARHRAALDGADTVAETGVADLS
jgi:hypothetical protein